jgi:hypothetical protein
MSGSIDQEKFTQDPFGMVSKAVIGVEASNRVQAVPKVCLHEAFIYKTSQLYEGIPNLPQSDPFDCTNPLILLHVHRLPNIQKSFLISRGLRIKFQAEFPSQETQERQRENMRSRH